MEGLKVITRDQIEDLARYRVHLRKLNDATERYHHLRETAWMSSVSAGIVGAAFAFAFVWAMFIVLTLIIE